jgi:hypothetical protein
MVLTEEERVSNTRWLVLGFVGLFFLVLLLGFLFWGLNSFFEGENALSLIFFAAFVFLSLGFAGLCKKYWSEFANSFLNFLVTVFFPAITQEGMFIIAAISLLILLSSIMSLNELLNLTALPFHDYFMNIGTLGVSLLILLFTPIFVAEIYYIVSEKKPSERFIRKVVYVNTFITFALAFLGSIHFLMSETDPEPLMMFGTAVLFFQGILVFVMMIFKEQFEERILEFRVVYDEPPTNTLKIVSVCIIIAFLLFKLILNFSIVLSALNAFGLAILVVTVAKWKFTHTVFETVKEKLEE